MKIFKDNKEFATIQLGDDGKAIIEGMDPDTFMTLFDITSFAGKTYTADDKNSKGWICGLFQDFNDRSHYRAVWEDADYDWNDMIYKKPYEAEAKTNNKFLKSLKK